MRNIKFRVWQPSSKSWVMGKSYIDCDNGEVCSYDEDYGGMFSSHKILEKTGRIIQQFTGLQDVNGNDIFEGDILYVQPKNARGWCDSVIFSNGSYTFHGYVLGASFIDHGIDVEIIGNIFENSELLHEIH